MDLFIVITWLFSGKTDTVSIIPDEKEQNAYIPYVYARNYVARITGDMTEMKSKHLCIVKDIDKHYRAIEDETQVPIWYLDVHLLSMWTVHRNCTQGVEPVWLSGNSTKEAKADGSMDPLLLVWLHICLLFSLNTVFYGHVYILSADLWVIWSWIFFIPLNPGFRGWDWESGIGLA